MTAESSEGHTIDDTCRGGLAVVADVLLPGTEQLPSGRDVACHEELMDRVLDIDTSLRPVVERVGRRAAAHGSCSLDDLMTWAEDDVEHLVRAFNLAYYMAPAVMQALRYPGQNRRPIADATPEERWDEELIAPVRARGPIYVPTPPS